MFTTLKHEPNYINILSSATVVLYSGWTENYLVMRNDNAPKRYAEGEYTAKQVEALLASTTKVAIMQGATVIHNFDYNEEVQDARGSKAL